MKYKLALKDIEDLRNVVKKYPKEGLLHKAIDSLIEASMTNTHIDLFLLRILRHMLINYDNYGFIKQDFDNTILPKVFAKIRLERMIKNES